MKTKLLTILLVGALLVWLIPLGVALANGPTWTLGQQSTATIKAVSKYRHLFNPGKTGWEGFVGKCEGGYECPGVTWDMNPAPYAATNHVTLMYDGTNTFTAVIDPDGAAGPFTRVYVAATAPGALNYLQLDLRGQVAGTLNEIVSFNNGTLNGNPLGDATGNTGFLSWYVTGVDLSAGFTLEGDMVLTWPLSNTGCDECNKLVLKVGYFEPPNEPPVANPNGPYLGAANTPIAFDGTGSSDPDGDLLTYAWTFGNGGTDTGATPSHSYAAAGIYDVCLTVNDGTVNSDPVCTIAIVYDPDGGFVTGGGWIDSPVNEDYQYMQVGGKATFGFVSKYKKGATVPEGNTEFQFQAGDLNFHSTSYDWLVVTGSNYAKFKGTGTINGAGEYKFQIWAGDGSPDTFRIKIWYEEAGSEVVVYDNGMEQPIGGGSIVVHTKN